MKYLKLSILVLFCLVIGINLYLTFFSTDPYLVARRRLMSPSVGERYYGRLSLWYLYAQKGDWSLASKLENKLDQADLINYKSTHRPQELRKTINRLVYKSNKTANDWVELARIQLILGQLQDATESITKAHQLDPIRDDISAIYYQLSR